MNQSISEILKKKIDSIEADTSFDEIGNVISVSDGIAKISGLHKCQAMELLLFENGSYGMALNLEEDSVGAVIFGEFKTIEEGQTVKRTKEVLTVPVSDDIVGRVVNALCEPIDGKGELTNTSREYVEKPCPGVIERQSVDTPLMTGQISVDALTPVGRGQRQLILGDRQTGKTTLAIDTILNQKGQDVICVYVAIGQKQSQVMRVKQLLEEHGAMDYTSIVLASASDTPSYLYLAPYAGVTIAEYFLKQGKDVLVIYDDLTKHAAAYRELSLLLKRPPGREAYPGDVFYLHSRLLERACRLNAENGGGSITALPIIETQAGDVSAYIPTNVISITDGQVFLESNLFNKGIRPAINVGLSVSRVGGAAQTKAVKKNSGSLKLGLAQYREMESFTQFGSDVEEGTRKILERGERAVELLKQKPHRPFRAGVQTAMLYALNHGYLDTLSIDEVAVWKESVYGALSNDEKALKEIEAGWDDSIEEKVKSILSEFSENK